MNPGIASLSDLFRLLWHRKFVLLLSGLATGALALGIALSLPPSYVGEGLLLVDAREPQIPALSVLAAAPADTTPQSRTETDELRSRALVEAVVRQLDLADNPEFSGGESRLRRAVTGVVRYAADAIGGSVGARLLALLPPAATPSVRERVAAAVATIRRRLEITRDDYSRVLTVRFAARSPTVAAAVVNTLFDRYITGEVAARRYIMQQTNRWLSERAAALWPEVEQADQAVQKFREANPLLEVAQGSLTAVQLNNEETDLSIARQDLLRRQAALDAARGAGFKEALTSPVIQLLRDREADAAQRMAIIAQRLGVRHPDYIAAARSLNEVRREIGAQTAKIAASLQQDVASAAQRVADLQARVAALQASAERSASAAIGLAQLTREADAKRRVYEAFMTRAAETQPTSVQFPPARVVSPAVAPQKPDRIPPLIVGIFGFLAGTFAASAASILRYLQRGGIGSVRELATVTDLPCLGALPALDRTRRRLGAPAALLDHGRDGAVETLRAMRFEVQAIAAERGAGGAVVLVTSSEVGDGKTTLAASFARLCAADGQRVLLLEADLRRPQLARTLGLNPTPDVEAALSETTLLADAVQVDVNSGLHCLTAAGCAASPHELLRSSSFASLLLRARRSYNLVVLDSPPVLHVADALLIAGMSDVILFAVRWDRTPRALVMEGLRRIPEEPRSRLVTVLTRVPADRLARSDYYAGYHTTTFLPRPQALTLMPPRRNDDTAGFLQRGLK